MKLCRDYTEAGEAVQSCVSPKIAAQGSMNALAHYRGEEATHRLTRNAVVFYSRHHAIFSELQRNILFFTHACKTLVHAPFTDSENGLFSHQCAK